MAIGIEERRRRDRERKRRAYVENPWYRKTDEHRALAREQSRQWRAANPEKRKAAARKQYAAHAEERRERSRVYREQHPDIIRETRKRNREKYPEKYREWDRQAKMRKKDKIRPKQQVRSRKAHLIGSYGITTNDYDRMVLEQDGRCGICLRETTDLCVDHDHETGKVRGLLCRNCNAGLGSFKDNVANLLTAIQYLNANKEYAAIRA